MRKIKLLGLIMLVSIAMYSQGRKDEVRQKIESKKIAYLTDELNLTVEESQVFWPIYNEYNSANKLLHKHSFSESDHKSFDEKLDYMIDIDQERLNIKKIYMDKIKVAIGAEKTLDFFLFERQFREKMLRDIKEKRTKMRSRGK